jgi:hypothetical protein
VANRLLAFERHCRRNVFIRQAVKFQELPPELDVRDGFDIKRETMHGYA